MIEQHKIEWTPKNEARYNDECIAWQRHIDGNFMIIQINSEAEELANLLISKGSLDQAELDQSKAILKITKKEK